MSKYGKVEGHHCWWLTINGKSVSSFDNESDIDDIMSMQENFKSQKETELVENHLDEANKIIDNLAQGINDWMNDYASEFCDEKRVKESRDRINEFGTLAYIARLNGQVDKFKLSQSAKESVE